MATRAPAGLEPDRQRVRELARRELAALNARTRASGALFRRAGRVLPGGVASSFQLRDPWPVYMTRGEGSRVWDADGNEYVDLHNGFGAMLQGHAHPAITAAVQARAAQGTHFGAPTEDAVVVAEELARRFRLPHWRFTNSGSESTMAAVRLARALTGRDPVVAIAGAYHGHHDTALATRKTTAGIPRSTLDLVHEVPFNDLEAMERAVEEHEPACVLMEPAMTHGGITPPKPGYLDAVRDATRRHGVVLIFDEVKTGLAIAAGGAVERYGVEPDIVTLAKAWERRTAIVATAWFIREGELDDTFAIAELLLSDDEDLIQKAVGGWLREAGKKDRPRLLGFLDDHASKMPRTMLRYAMEHLDEEQRAHYRAA